MTGDPVMVSGVHWAPQHSKRAWKTAGSWQEQEGGEAAAGVQDLRATGDPCSVGDLVTQVGGGDRLCFLQVTDPRGWESMEDMAGGHQGIRKSASVVCGRLAFLVQCGRPQGGWRHSRGEESLGETLAPQLADKRSLCQPLGICLAHLLVCTNTPLRLITNH